MLLAIFDLDRVATAQAPQAITVDVDLTFLVELVLFVGLMLVLKPLLFDPMLTLFEERERRIDGAKLQARKIDEKSASALSTYEAEMAKARTTGNAERDKIRAEGMAREQQILGAMRASTSKVIDEGKRVAHAEADKVRGALKLQSAEIAREIASRVLGRDVQP
jgi:F-type H+-transporting ATPase subunit b